MSKLAPKKAKNETAVSKTACRTAEDTALLLDFNRRKAAKRALPKIELKSDKRKNVQTLSVDCSDAELAKAILLNACGTTDDAFFDGLSKQVVNASEKDIGFMFSVIAGIEPRDQIEAMLAAQMAAVHMSSMTFARRLAHVQNISQQDSAERAFNKLARTFTTQMEALNRYRGKGQQKMTVEHVHVHEGGQAIVGNLEGGGKNQN